MDTQVLFLIGALGLGATVALAFAERAWKGGGPVRAPKLDRDPAPLRDAAYVAYDFSKSRRLAMAHVAERGGDAVEWFENNLLRNAPISATSVTNGAVERLGAAERARLRVVPGGLARSGDGAPEYLDPVVRAKDFKAYLRWVYKSW